MKLYSIRQDTGIIDRRLRISSQGFQDEPIDMVVTYKGIYILTVGGSYYCGENYCYGGDQWDSNLPYT